MISTQIASQLDLLVSQVFFILHDINTDCISIRPIGFSGLLFYMISTAQIASQLDLQVSQPFYFTWYWSTQIASHSDLLVSRVSGRMPSSCNFREMVRVGPDLFLLPLRGRDKLTLSNSFRFRDCSNSIPGRGYAGNWNFDRPRTLDSYTELWVGLYM